MLLAKDEVQVNKQCDLEECEGEKELFNSPLLDQMVVEVDQGLNRFLLKDFVLVCVCKLPEEFRANAIRVMVQLWQVNELDSDRFLNDSFIILVFLLLHQAIFKSLHVEP